MDYNEDISEYWDKLVKDYDKELREYFKDIREESEIIIKDFNKEYIEWLNTQTVMDLEVILEL